jgi:glutamate synthase (NADPH/NADH) small chain
MALSPKERMAIERQRMPEREPMVRNRDFHEVNLGFEESVAKLEADRCLQCKDGKCIYGCPVGIDIPGFLERISAGDIKGAAILLLEANSLPGITGRVCPQEEQCEKVCIRGKKGAPVAVGHLERYVADWARENLDMKTLLADPTGFRVAVVGSGPAGLTCAGELAKKGHDVTIFEALQAGRRAVLRHPRVPPAEPHHRFRGRSSARNGRQDHLQRGYRSYVHGG